MNQPGRLRVILTGARSFAAKALGPALLAEGAEIWPIVRALPLTVAWAPPGSPGLNVVAGDLADPLTWRGVPADVDAIIHLASRVENPATPASAFLRDNVDTVRALIGHAKSGRIGRVINFSSMSVHGRITDPVVDASTGSHDPTAYGQSKRWAELLLAEAARDVASVSLRLPGIVGPDAHGNWLARCRRTFRANTVLRATNPNFSFNNAVHVEDLARFVVSLCRREIDGASAVPIAAAEPIRIDAMLALLASAIGSTARVEFSETDRRPFAISSEQAVAEFGYEPASVTNVIERFAREP